jgi:hypothetical protein
VADEEGAKSARPGFQAIVLMEADITSEVAFVGLWIFWKEVVLLDGSLDCALAASSKR